MRNSFKVLGTFLALALFVGLTNTALATKKTATGSGNWSTLTWSPTGVPASTDTVYLDFTTGTRDSVVVDGADVCAALHFQRPSTSGAIVFLVISGTNSLTIGGGSGELFDTGMASSSRQINIRVGAGSLSCGTLTIGGTNSHHDSLTVTTGSVTATSIVFGAAPSGADSTGIVDIYGLGVIYVSGNFSGGHFIGAFGSKVNYDGNGAQNIGGYNYSQLVLTGSGTKTLAANDTVSHTLILGGTATLALSTFTMTYGTGVTLDYQGTAAQTTNAAVEFTSVIQGSGNTILINNPSGVNLGASYTENGTLNLDAGPFNTGANTVTIGSTGSVSQTSGYVDGNLEQTVTLSGSPVTFEVGDAGYSPVTISSTAGATGTVTVSAVHAAPPDVVDPTNSLGRYWVVNSSSVTGYSAQFNYLVSDVNGTESAYQVGHLNGSNVWDVLGGSVDATNHDLTISGLTVFGDFTGGSPLALPIKISSFTASAVSGNNVTVNWTMMTQTNSYGYYVQRSTDKVTWATKSGFIPGAGTTLQSESYSWTDNNVTSGTYYYRIQEVDLNGAQSYSTPIKFVISGTTGVTGQNKPLTFALNQNYPNPFNPTTQISFELPEKGVVTLTVYNVIGQAVATLLNHQEVVAGNHQLSFDGSALSSGVYYYRISVQGSLHAYESVHKMVLLK
jgi:hypothetical protein